LETIVAILQSGVFCLLSGFYITEVLRRKDTLRSALSNYSLFIDFFYLEKIFMKKKMKDTSNKWYKLFIRWFCSTNAKDIGMMYLVFARWSGVIATTMSLLIRME
jgi:hypothetical protein